MSKCRAALDFSAPESGRILGTGPDLRRPGPAAGDGPPVHEEFGGTFDITVGPLVRLVSFGADGDPGSARTVPDEFNMVRTGVCRPNAAAERSDGRPVLHRRVPGVELDLSGIAKGYAVDRISDMLTQRDLTEHLVEIGGEIRTRGVWTLGVHDPSAGLAIRVHRLLPVLDLAMATSGGYRDFRPAAGEGRFWTHILDPRSGWPVERRTGSVTVLADSCLEADAWATALYVLGPDEGFGLAAQQGTAALFLTVGADGAVEGIATVAFTAATRAPGY